MATLSSDTRTALRQRLREHPDVKNFVPSKSSIAVMTKAELLDLAGKLGIDVTEVETQYQAHEADMEHVQTLSPAARRKRELHNDKHPAFRGTIEFDLNIGAFGVSTTRKARLTYSYTPWWEYYDLVLGRPHIGWEKSLVAVETLVVPDEDALEEGFDPNNEEPYWEQLDAGPEILNGTIMAQIYAEIDKRCRDEDARRREETGKSGPLNLVRSGPPRQLRLPKHSATSKKLH